jgi:2-polyprenyl-6-methoxyphenol hydroxylase-like FAD-dependent oxidoreductase
MEKGVEAQKQALHEYLDDAGWEAKRILRGMDDVKDFYMSRAAQIKLPKWTNGRACVLGDAAHATFGVGTTLAIEGAYILAGELSKIQSSSDVPQALEKFEEVFRPLYAKSEGLPPGFPQLAFPQTSWGLWLQKCFLWFVTKTKLYTLFQCAESGTGYPLLSYDWKDL